MPTGTIHLAVLDTLADWEIGYLTSHLRNGHHTRADRRFEIRLVGLTDEPVTTMGGLRLTPDLTVAGLDPRSSDMLVLPGAETWDAAANVAFVDAARAFLEAGTPVAAVCGATFALAAAGLLDDRPHTSNDPGYLAASGYAGGDHYVTDRPAVIDGDLVTASGVAPAHFAAAVFERLDAFDPGVLASWLKLYGDRDPAGFYELMSA